MRSALGVLLLLAGCSLDHRSDELECSSPSDCANDRTCVDGYCVESSSQCPPACSTCDVPNMICRIDGATSPNGNATCPSGWDCIVDCGGNECRDVDCNGATSCTVTCSGNTACDSVRCGSGPCTVTCSGQRACGSVDCRDACSCDVTCADAMSCENPSQCTDNACESGDGCTSQPAGCDSC